MAVEVVLAAVEEVEEVEVWLERGLMLTYYYIILYIISLGGLVGEGADADAVLALGETVPGLAGADYPILAEVQCFE